MPKSNSTRFAEPLDLNGRSFTRLKVIGFSHKKIGVWFWKCQCSCGNILNVAGYALNNGGKKSCGCLNRDRLDAMGDPARFFNMFVKAEGCWEWTGKLDDKDGYGKFVTKKKKYMAHRYAWMLENGEIPKGKLILHKCDNPRCVRVSHLFIGDQLRNMQDKINKERENVREGETCPLAKLNREQVKEIRRRLGTGESCGSIAKDFPTTAKNVSMIKRRVSWNFKQEEKRSRIPMTPTKVMGTLTIYAEQLTLPLFES